MATLHEIRTGSREHVDLNTFATGLAQILSRVISSRVKIETAVYQETLAVYIDQVRFQQLIIGWALHAAGRMARRGALGLKTSRIVHNGTEFAGLTSTATGSEFPTG